MDNQDISYSRSDVFFRFFFIFLFKFSLNKSIVLKRALPFKSLPPVSPTCRSTAVHLHQGCCYQPIGLWCSDDAPERLFSARVSPTSSRPKGGCGVALHRADLVMSRRSSKVPDIGESWFDDSANY